MSFWRGVGVGAGGMLGLGALAAGMLARPMINRLTGTMLERTVKGGKYDESLAEMLATGSGRKPIVLMETLLRAERGKTVSRPLYASKRFMHFDDLMFVPAQLARMTTNENEYINLETTIGRRAERPLHLKLPVYVTGMLNGLSLTHACKLALAQGASAVGTATNSGEGGLHPEERAAAKHFILQYTRGGWPADPETLRQADAIEIQVGQGAQAGSPQSTPGWKLKEPDREAMGLDEGQDALIHSRFPGVESAADFKAMVGRIRSQVDGIPVGVKLAAGHHLERDIEVAVDAGADFITVDGAQASSHSAAPILLDDFGIPSVVALVRAARALRGTDVDLVISGGFMTPGEILKALALGADAVAVGAAPVMACIGTQWKEIAPFEPPTTLVWHDGKHRDKFDVDQGARGVKNWFNAVADELVLGVRCVGKSGVHQVGPEDLCALTPEIAAVTGVELAWREPGAARAEGVESPLPFPWWEEEPRFRLPGLPRDANATETPDPVH